MKSLIATGRCPYQLHQRDSLQALGVNAELYENWGIHLPDHVEALLAMKPDIIHLQWPESLVGIKQELSDDEILSGFSEALPRLRDSAAKLFWVMHNLLPHDRKRADFWSRLYQVFADHVDVCCHHSRCGEKRVRETYAFKHADHALLRHGFFHGDVYPAVSKAEAREKLGLPRDIILFLNVGSLRPDKQIEEMLNAFTGRRAWLALAGIVQGEYGERMAERGDAMPNVIVHRGYTENETVSLLANAADCFLFMQGEHHLTSGAPHLSQAHLLPQVSLDYAYAREVMGENAIYIRPDAQRFEQLANTLDGIDSDQLAQFAMNLKATRDPWRWDIIGLETRRAYEKSLANGQ